MGILSKTPAQLREERISEDLGTIVDAADDIKKAADETKKPEEKDSASKLTAQGSYTVIATSKGIKAKYQAPTGEEYDIQIVRTK